jgi:hypothetical protein
MRCCLKTLTQGLTDEEEKIITWVKEPYMPLTESRIEFLSPSNGENYEANETITSISSSSYNKYDIVVQKIISTTEQYRLKKVINGIEVNPPEYDGNIYKGKTSITSGILSVDSYNINFEEL